MGEEKHGLSELSCSFCGKGKDEVKKLIAGPKVYICDECIGLCQDIIYEEDERDGQDPEREIANRILEMYANDPKEQAFRDARKLYLLLRERERQIQTAVETLRPPGGEPGPEDFVELYGDELPPDLGNMPEDERPEALAKRFRTAEVSAEDLASLQSSLATLLPKSLCEKHAFVPFDFRDPDRKLILAVSDQTLARMDVLGNIKLMLNVQVFVRVGKRSDILEAIERLFAK